MSVYILGAALLVALALVFFQGREFTKERASLLDRIQAPESVAAVAFSRAAAPASELPDTDAEDDRAFGRDITEELDWIPLGMDE